jgi:hypothetical protein
MKTFAKGLFSLFSLLVLQSCSTSSLPKPSTKKAILIEWSTIKTTILAQRRAGYPNYDPKWIYVVDPAAQQMNVVSLKTGEIYETLRCGTGKRGLGIALKLPLVSSLWAASALLKMQIFLFKPVTRKGV